MIETVLLDNFIGFNLFSHFIYQQNIVNIHGNKFVNKSLTMEIWMFFMLENLGILYQVLSHRMMDER